jgi:hypothetical protein
LDLFEHLDEAVDLLDVDGAFVLSVEDFEDGLVLDLIYREVIGCHY